jgi:hypothetical protein
MKRTLLLLVALVVMGISQQAQAQGSVNDAIKYAEKYQKKGKSKDFKKFKKSYENALKDIASIEAQAAKDEFGNDLLVEKIPGWIKFYDALAEFEGGKVTSEDETITLEMKDYKPVLEKAKADAAKAHFDAAVKVIGETKSFNTRSDKAFEHFRKANEYSKEYKDQITEYRAQVYYEEGKRRLDEGKNFDEKAAGKSYFEGAMKEIPDYKDSKELMAELFYNEGVKLVASKNVDEISAGIGHINTACKFIPNYKESEAKIKAGKENAAESLYQQAVAKEKEQTFAAQLEASELFKKTNDWVKDYKDATARADAALKRAEVNVYVIETDMTILQPNLFSYKLQEKTNSYIKTPPAPEGMDGGELRDPMNFKNAVTKLGHGYVFICMGTGSTGYTYKAAEPEVIREDVFAYFQEKTDAVTKEKERKEISKKDYDAMKKIIDIAGEDGGTKLFEYKGVVTKTVYKSSYTGTFELAIWDVRNPASAKIIKTIKVSKSLSDTKTKETYSGSPEAKPSRLKNDEGSVKTEAQFKAEADKSPMTVKNMVNDNMSKIVDALNTEIKYMAK